MDDDDAPFVQSKPQPIKQEQKKRKRDSEEKKPEDKEEKTTSESKKVKEEPESKKEKEELTKPSKKEAPAKKETPTTPKKKAIENAEKPLKKRLSTKDTPSKDAKKEDEKKDEKDMSDEEEEEEEESPKKKTPAKKPAKKTPAKKTPKKTSPAKKKSKKEESEDSDDENDSEDPSESESESDGDEDGSDYDEDDSPKKKTPKKSAPKKTPAKKTPKKTTPAKKKSKKEESEEDESDEEEEEEKSPKKSPKKTPAKKSTPKKKGKKDEGEEKDEDSKSPKKKGKKKKEEEPIREWWNEKPLPKGQKWRTLSHNGVLFPDPYIPHGVKLLYDGKPVDLKPEEEEFATYYARYLDTDHVKKPIFRENFFADWKQICNPKGNKNHWLKDFDKCDFTQIKNYLEEQKLLKKKKTKEEKEEEKKKKEEIDNIYGIAMVDGFKEKISNFRIEPPGLFLGRGKHPKTGKIKQRVTPEQVTINIGKKEKPPKCPIEGHSWGKIIHDNTVTWLAHWKENVNGQCKYVWLAPSSKIKGQADMEKFEKARRLKKHIKKIREEYTKDLDDDDVAIRQRAVCIYFIDHLALRVGNEKDKSKSADTVGCCSLRVEHVKALDNLKIEFDFLGKDSMHYHNVVKVDKKVYDNVKKFLKGKKPHDKLFDQLTVTVLNKHLKSHMAGLTAKVFRTYNASVTLQKELEKTPNDEDTTTEEKILYYNRANRQVAILCNHKKSVPKKFGEQIEKIDYKIDVISEEIDLITEAILKKKGKKYKGRSKEDQEAFETRRDRIVEFEEKEEQRSLERQKDKEVKKEFKRSDPEKELPDDLEKLKTRLAKLEESLKKQEINKQQREENSEVALGTSKINYNDPRITVAWTKKYDVPLEKVFSANLRKKFPWAQMADKDYVF